MSGNGWRASAGNPSTRPAYQVFYTNTIPNIPHLTILWHTTPIPYPTILYNTTKTTISSIPYHTAPPYNAIPYSTCIPTPTLHKNKTRRFRQKNKLAKLGDATAISKSETITHSLTHSLGDAIASKKQKQNKLVWGGRVSANVGQCWPTFGKNSQIIPLFSCRRSSVCSVFNKHCVVKTVS